MNVNKGENIKAFKSFMKLCKMDFGQEIRTIVVAYNADGEEIFDDEVKCFFSEEIGYSQFSISILWSMSETVMHNLGLYGIYNTNYQKFIFDNNQLEIHNENGTIIYVEGKE